MVKNIFVSLLGLALASYVSGHGRLLDPPGRATIWRFPEFQMLNPPKNYNDNELNCGGASVQHGQNGGRCGECGDAYDLIRPRPNELGGFYDRGIIVRNYKAGQTIEVDIHITASHMGYMEFRLCKIDSELTGEKETQECFDRTVLELEDGGTKFSIPAISGHYYPKVKLPTDLTCDRCVLQWHYRAGNNWGYCDDGSGAMGCGPQETFRACSDISISQ